MKKVWKNKAFTHEKVGCKKNSHNIKQCANGRKEKNKV